MAASSRSGFPGGFSGGDGPTDVQSARTLYGHDLHLEPGSVDISPAHQERPPEPEDPRPVTTEEEFTPPARFASHSGKSRFPALARLFGRWNTGGQFEANASDELDVVPRERILRPLAIVVATSAISFFIVVALLKLRDNTAPEPAPAVATPAAAQPRAIAPAPRTVAPAPTAPTAPASAPRPVPERARPLSEVLERAIAQRDASRPAAKRAAPRRARRIVVPTDPDSPMPLSF